MSFTQFERKLPSQQEIDPIVTTEPLSTMSTTTTQQTTAFFGATGGCAGFCLANTLKAGISCRALVRVRDKLLRTLNEKGVTQDIIDQNLTIIEGNVMDVDAVKRTILLPHGRDIVSKIVSGLGSNPKLQWSLRQPVTIENQSICRDATRSIHAAITALGAPTKPFIINISTTGITTPEQPRDIPRAYHGLYHWLLAVPHEDKAEMDRLTADAAKQGILAGFVNVKPTLLFDGPARGVVNIRCGTDAKPAVGMMVNREDIGNWMAENLVKVPVADEWRGRGVSLTY